MTTQKARRIDRERIRDAVRKEVSSMHLDASDIVIVHASDVLAPVDQMEFAHSLARVVESVSDCAHVIVVPFGMKLESMTQEDLLQRGLVRVLPSLNPGAGGVNWDALEDDAHQMVRMGFEYAKEKWPC